MTGAAIGSESLSIPQDQLEQALERVIKKLYADKIETILVEVIEKTVKAEIERVKTLIRDATGDDSI
jgi:hypothetical protein